MPIFFQQEIDKETRLAIWKIEEEERFFGIPLHREITHPHKRLQHLAGRYLLKYLFPDFPLDLVKIAGTRKPFLENEAYHFSISHCGDFAAAIISKTRRVGVDIEIPTPKVEKIKNKFLHPDELEWVSGERTVVSLESHGLQTTSEKDETPDLRDNHKPQTTNYKLTLLWSAKEAVFKWWSYGGVDFSEMIRLQRFELQPSGSFQGLFRSTNEVFPLAIHYQLFENLCIAWVFD